jgi:hypothetical protein
MMFAQIIPSWDCHMDCKPENFEISRVGLPFPRLDVHVQSLLDMNSLVDLTDLLDGMDLTEEWGEQHLKLDGTFDLEWNDKKNQAIRDSVPLTEYSFVLERGTTPFKRRDTWLEIVGGKKPRLGFKYSEEFYVTWFRIRGTPDPRTEYCLPPPSIEEFLHLMH